MFIFSKKTSTFIGVDIGSSSIKMVELEERNGEPSLKNYGFAERKKSSVINNEASLVSRSSEVIKRIYKQTGFGSKDVVAALHNFDVFTSVINIPDSDPKQLESIVKIEARKFVPIPLEDVVLDWKVLDKKNPSLENADNSKKDKDKNVNNKKENDREKFFADQEKGVDILLTAAPRKLVGKYIDIFQKADLNLLSLETESFAFIRALLDKNDSSSQMIIDIGSTATDIIIVENQIPVVIRTVDVGGSSITSAIAHNLGIGTDRAEQFKRDIGIVFDKGGQSNNDAVVQIIESSFSPVINEVNYSIDLYKSRNRSIEKIILSGGSAYLSGMVDFLKSKFGLPVYIGDPWHKVSYPKGLEHALKEFGPSFTVAIGLALKEIVE